MNVLDNSVYIEIQHTINRHRIGVNQITADIGAGIAVQDINLSGLCQNLWNHGCAALGIEKIRDLRNCFAATIGDDPVESLLVAVDHHHGGARCYQRFCCGETDA